MAINHTGYPDFTFAGLPVRLPHPRRLVRFMAKQEIFDHGIGGPLMRGMRHIPVDCSSGAASFDAAVQALKDANSSGVPGGDDQPQLRTQGVQERRGPDGDRRRRRSCRTSSGAPSGSGPGPSQEDVAPEGADLRRGGRTDPAHLPPVELTALLRSRMQHLLDQVQDAQRALLRPVSSGFRTDSEEERRRRHRRPSWKPPKPPNGRPVASSGRWGGLDGTVYRGIEIVSRRRRPCSGHPDHLPGYGEHSRAHGGAVVAMNHISYIDYPPAGLATRQRRRRIRYMLKAGDAGGPFGRLDHQAHPVHPGRPLGRRGAYAEAVRALRDGELVGCSPEATISRSFEPKEFKSGAARMALERGFRSSR